MTEYILVYILTDVNIPEAHLFAILSIWHLMKSAMNE